MVADTDRANCADRADRADAQLLVAGAEKDEMTKRARSIGSSIHEEVEVEDPVMMTIIDIDLRAYAEIFF